MMRFFLLRLSREFSRKLLKPVHPRREHFEISLGNEKKREREKEGERKEHRRRRRLEDTKREMLIHGRRVSSSFVSYLNDPLTISFILHGEHLIPDTLVCSRFRDELNRNLRACSCLTYVELFACANWFILVQTPFSLSLSLSCRRSISLWAGGLEKAD